MTYHAYDKILGYHEYSLIIFYNTKTLCRKTSYAQNKYKEAKNSNTRQETDKMYVVHPISGLRPQKGSHHVTSISLRSDSLQHQCFHNSFY